MLGRRKGKSQAKKEKKRKEAITEEFS